MSLIPAVTSVFSPKEIAHLQQAMSHLAIVSAKELEMKRGKENAECSINSAGISDIQNGSAKGNCIGDQ